MDSAYYGHLGSSLKIDTNIDTVSAAYTGELGNGHFLRYKRKSGLTGDFYLINEFLGFKKPLL